MICTNGANIQSGNEVDERTRGNERDRERGRKHPQQQKLGSKPNKLKAYGNCDLLTYCWNEAIDLYLIAVKTAMIAHKKLHLIHKNIYICYTGESALYIFNEWPDCFFLL